LSVRIPLRPLRLKKDKVNNAVGCEEKPGGYFKAQIMAKDNSPVRHTCPDIDEAQQQAKSAIDVMADAREYLMDFVKQLEKLREENAELRKWGNEECERADDLERDLEDANKTIKDLESEVKYQKQEIGELTDQVNALESVTQ
jgi:chromosome segregation ATPase